MKKFKVVLTYSTLFYFLALYRIWGEIKQSKWGNSIFGKHAKLNDTWNLHHLTTSICFQSLFSSNEGSSQTGLIYQNRTEIERHIENNISLHSLAIFPQMIIYIKLCTAEENKNFIVLFPPFIIKNELK